MISHWRGDCVVVTIDWTLGKVDMRFIKRILVGWAIARVIGIIQGKRRA
jgi:hypothetical protein